MKTVTIDKDRFNEIGKDVYLLNDCGLTLNTELFRYTDLSTLFGICKGEIRINLRNSFSDRREHGEISNPWIEGLLPVGQKMTKRNKARIDGYRKKRELAGYMPTLCFTKNPIESFAMWNSYTTGYTGVRIKTTIENIISSIDLENHEMYIGPMEYFNNDIGCFIFERYIFVKNKCYEFEDEIRLYIIPKSGISNRINTLELPIKCESFISEITLSPFLPKTINHELMKFFRESFSFIKNNINYSSILERSK